jgi:hypothetical protein
MSSSRANKPVKKPTVLSKKHVIAVGNGSKHVKLDSNSSESSSDEDEVRKFEVRISKCPHKNTRSHECNLNYDPIVVVCKPPKISILNRPVLEPPMLLPPLQGVPTSSV